MALTNESTWQQYREALNAFCAESLLSDVESPELLFRYTSAESCFRIIDPESGPRLWASCALGMNDASEIRYGVELVREIASQFVTEKELKPMFASHYKYKDDYAVVSFLESTCVACFCDRSDLLSQWRAYGRSATGYCLGFRRNLLSAAGIRAGFQLVPVIYKREQQIEKLRTIFDKARALLVQDRPEPEWRLWSTTINTVLDLSAAFKPASFSEECEWRLISTSPCTLQYRPGRSGVIPYSEIELPKESLAEIWQGPTLDYDLNRRTLEMYLVRTYGTDQKGESVVRVRRSEIPLRKLET